MASVYALRDLRESDTPINKGLFVYCVGFESRSSFIATIDCQVRLERWQLFIIMDIRFHLMKT
jgi:hypothetical protein